MLALTDDLEEVVRENLRLRYDLMAEVAKASEPVPFGHKVRQWWSARFGRSDDQPLIFAPCSSLSQSPLRLSLGAGPLLARRGDDHGLSG